MVSDENDGSLILFRVSDGVNRAKTYLDDKARLLDGTIHTIDEGSMCRERR
jgi:hypothetical protein